MTTVSGSQTAVGFADILTLGNEHGNIDYSVSGPGSARVDILESRGGRQGAWRRVAGPFEIEDGTFTGRFQGKANSHYCVHVADFTSGTVVSSLTAV